MGVKNWKLAGNNLEHQIESVQRKFSLPRPIAVYFAARGIGEDQVQDFLSPRLSQLSDPYRFPGIREAEKRIIAAVARYHRKATPQRSHEEYAALPEAAKVTVLKLAAILRVADALTHLEQAGSFKLILHGKVLTIRAADLEGVSFSSVYLKSKSDLFYEVFGLEIRLEEAPVQL